MIYIDPPYGKDSMGEFAKTNYDNAISRDNLLSMLDIRLRLAKELLTDDGVIFCSIDDRNQAYIKCLFDEIFGESNFYGNFIQLKGNTQNDSKTIQKNHEYILCYVKKYNELLLTYKNTVKYKVYEDEYYLGRDTGASSGHDTLLDRNNLGYTIYYYEGTGNGVTGNHNTLLDRNNLGYNDYKIYKKGNKYIQAIALNDYKIENLTSKSTENDIYENDQYLVNLGFIPIRPPKRTGGQLGRWTWGIDTFKQYWNNNEVLIKNNKNVIRKIFVDSHDITEINGSKYYISENILPPQSIIDITNSEGSTELNEIFNKNIFNNPKNSELIKYFIKLSSTSSDDIILDFFAGSGTTGQAVLEANKEDGGNRKFILVQQHEDLGKGSIQESFCKENNLPISLSSITYERLKRVMTGKTSKGDSDFDWIKKNEALGGALDVYEIASVNNYENIKGKTAFDVIDETLYGLPKFKDVNDKIKWVCENFEYTMKVEDKR